MLLWMKNLISSLFYEFKNIKRWRMHQAITVVWRRLRHLFDMSVVNMDSKRERGGGEREGRREKEGTEKCIHTKRSKPLVDIVVKTNLGLGWAWFACNQTKLSLKRSNQTTRWAWLGLIWPESNWAWNGWNRAWNRFD